MPAFDWSLEYTITEPAKQAQLPEFLTDPAFCSELLMNYVLLPDLNLQQASLVSFTPGDRMLEVDVSSSLELAGLAEPYATVYTL